MKTLSEKILEKIEKGKIQQKPKNFFIIRNIFNWILTILAVLLASFFISSVYFIIVNKLVIPGIVFTIFVLLGVLFILLASYLSYQRFKYIKNFYKHKLSYVIVLFLVFILIIGSLFARLHVYSSFDSFVSKNIPSLSTQKNIYKIWSQPESGRLAGEIIGIEEGYILLEGFDKKIYFIDPVYINEDQRDLFLDFLRVKMYGYQDGDFFYPLDVSEWTMFNTKNRMHKEYMMPFVNENINFRHKGM